MKQALKKAQLAIVRSEEAASDSLEQDAPSSLNEFFSGWLDSVAPELSRVESRPNKFLRPRYKERTISSTEMVRVNRATVRESTDHRHWPPEVVAQFLAADVIRTKPESNR